VTWKMSSCSTDERTIRPEIHYTALLNVTSRNVTLLYITLRYLTLLRYALDLDVARYQSMSDLVVYYVRHKRIKF
jgi:hypothetical protein